MASASATMSYTGNASGDPMPNGITFYPNDNYYDGIGKPNWYVQPDWTYKPTINPIWDNPIPIPNIWPTVPVQPTITFPAVQTTTPAWTFMCPHCGHNHNVSSYANFNWICESCHQSMLIFNVTTTPGVGTYPLPVAAPAPAITPAAKETPPPEKKENHPGDGTRWEDI